jgi:hypothetical protein
VKDDAAQPPGLGVDMESHASILTIGGRLDPPMARFRDVLFSSS